MLEKLLLHIFFFDLAQMIYERATPNFWKVLSISIISSKLQFYILISGLVIELFKFTLNSMGVSIV